MATIRLRIEIDEDRVQELESLMQECGIRTKIELFNNAITLFKWAVNNRRAGREIAAVNPDGGQYIELDMPALSAVQKSQ
jgi:hypothetical protein